MRGVRRARWRALLTAGVVVPGPMSRTSALAGSAAHGVGCACGTVGRRRQVSEERRLESRTEDWGRWNWSGFTSSSAAAAASSSTQRAACTSTTDPIAAASSNGESASMAWPSSPPVPCDAVPPISPFAPFAPFAPFPPCAPPFAPPSPLSNPPSRAAAVRARKSTCPTACQSN
eukprot:984073-Prymnesium_polylepis.1